jgi:hypothetical protein
MATSVLDHIRAVEHEKVKVKTETLRKVRQALNELNKLGFDYRVVGNGSFSESIRRRSLQDAPCKICGFRTLRPHDARAHRGQAKKAPFTRKELAERGLRRV